VIVTRSVLPCALSVASREVRADTFSGPSDFAALANSFVIAWISDALSGLDFLHPAANKITANIAAIDRANARRFRRADIPRFKKDAITRNILRDAKLK
jgi:hypothetical protein